ncbi:expressed unknown protein [Seminavis robusta]|uniref:Uncharacterized protein n=1 Tax=Seminavis robusta TaxID=568900 RepID=A0A9N8DKU2_9STRA|nr:expressed unknown protein [Seminavis robusta]|eukprot:Sro112_g055700.1 n/a (302) ;mRNA; f:67954-68859
MDVESQESICSSSKSLSCTGSHHDGSVAKHPHDGHDGQSSSTPPNRPRIVQAWIHYGVAGRMALDVLLWLSNPQFWQAATNNGTSPFLIRNTLNTVIGPPEHQLYNADHLLTVTMVLVSVVVPNIIESSLLAGYRTQMTQRWPQLLVHHILLLAWVFLVLFAGKGIVASQAIISLTHLFYLPLAFFPHWRHWQSYYRVALLASFVIGGYLLSSAIHLSALFLLWTSPVKRSYMGNSQYAYYVVGSYLVLFNIEIIAGVVTTLHKRRQNSQPQNVDEEEAANEAEPETSDDTEDNLSAIRDA